MIPPSMSGWGSDQVSSARSRGDGSTACGSVATTSGSCCTITIQPPASEIAAFAYVNVFRDHVNVGFFHGAFLPDPAGLLEGTGKRMRHVKLRPGVKLDGSALEALITASYTDIKARVKNADHSDVFGEFEVCRLQPDRPGQMRSACIAGAKRLVVQDRGLTRPPIRLLSTWPLGATN